MGKMKRVLEWILLAAATVVTGSFLAAVVVILIFLSIHMGVFL